MKQSVLTSVQQKQLNRLVVSNACAAIASRSLLFCFSRQTAAPRTKHCFFGATGEWLLFCKMAKEIRVPLEASGHCFLAGSGLSSVVVAMSGCARCRSSSSKR